jgi:SPP1 gp7 family putative phage head morphogenesis protein
LLTIGEELQRRAAVDAAGRSMGLAAGRTLRTAFKRVAGELQRESLSLSRRAELTAFLARSSATLGAAYQKVAAEQVQWARTVAKGMGEHTSAAMERLLGQQGRVLLTAERVDAIVALPIMDLPLGDWWRREATQLSERVRTALQQGLLQGLSMRDIARSLSGVDPRDRSAYRAALARAMTVARTTASAVATHTDKAIFAALGPGITDRYVYRATLDGRTSTICRGADGRVFRYGEAGALEPPLHPNCRSTIIPLINPQGRTDDQKRRLREFYGTDGRLPPTRTPKMYDDWLKKQPRRVQEEILGTELATRFRAGDVALLEALGQSRLAFSTEKQMLSTVLANAREISAPVVPQPAARGRPSGVLSKAQDIFSHWAVSPEIQREAREVLSAIDTVHYVPDRKIRLGFSHLPPSSRGVLGLVSRSGLQLKTGLGPRKVGSTVSHEYGHVVDWMLAPPGTAKSTGKFASGSWRTTAGAASEHWKDFWSVVKNSPEYRGWQDSRATARGSTRDLYDYALEDEEVFARGYAQWIGRRVNRPGLYAGSAFQWSEASFPDLSKAYDRLFQALGLLK